MVANERYFSREPSDKPKARGLTIKQVTELAAGGFGDEEGPSAEGHKTGGIENARYVELPPGTVLFRFHDGQAIGNWWLTRHELGVIVDHFGLGGHLIPERSLEAPWPPPAPASRHQFGAVVDYFGRVAPEVGPQMGPVGVAAAAWPEDDYATRLRAGPRVPGAIHAAAAVRPEWTGLTQFVAIRLHSPLGAMHGPGAPAMGEGGQLQQAWMVLDGGQQRRARQLYVPGLGKLEGQAFITVSRGDIGPELERALQQVPDARLSFES